MLACMFAGDLAPSNMDKAGRYFIDRSGKHFGTILSYFRGDQLFLKLAHMQTRAIMQEAQYYQVRTQGSQTVAFSCCN